MSTIVEWCRRELEAAEETLALFELGHLRFTQHGRDISEGHITHLRMVVAELRGLLSGVG